MITSAFSHRLPALLLLALVALVTLIDWSIDLSNAACTPAKVEAAWEELQAGNYSPPVFLTLFTTLSAAFLHGDASHLLGNALFLWIFSAAVLEITSWRWLFTTFILTAIGGSLGHILMTPQSSIPMVGASGAVMGLEGFYFGLALLRPRPESHVWPISRPVTHVQLAAVAAVGIYLDLMGIYGPESNIAYGAHLGGFVTGLLLSTLADRSAVRA